MDPGPSLHLGVAVTCAAHAHDRRTIQSPRRANWAMGPSFVRKSTTTTAMMCQGHRAGAVLCILWLQPTRPKIIPLRPMRLCRRGCEGPALRLRLLA